VHRGVVVAAQSFERHRDAAQRALGEQTVALDPSCAGAARSPAGRIPLAPVERRAQILDPLAAALQLGRVEVPAVSALVRSSHGSPPVMFVNRHSPSPFIT
jgi:hypothetical protein